MRDNKGLENLPHLILVPGTLCSQWEVEIKSIIMGHTFTILLYGTGKAQHDHFWAADGPYHTAKLSGANIIIIASHSVSRRAVSYKSAPHTFHQALQQDFSMLYVWTKPKGDLPWANPPPLPTYKALVSKTLFGQRYLSITLDEAQGFRNVGAKHSAAFLILQLASFLFILTATPLQTSTKVVSILSALETKANSYKGYRGHGPPRWDSPLFERSRPRRGEV